MNDKCEFYEYFSAVYDGRITACKKIKKAAELLLEAAEMPGEFHFDIEIAKRHVEFMERFCCFPTGKKMGEPFKMELFQKARFQALFGFVDDDGLRQYQECLIVEGRKNGKTSETACVEHDMLINDGEGSPQVYNLATKLEQAMLGFNAVLKMREMSPMLSKHERKRVGDIYFPLNKGYIKPMSSDTKGLDGLDVHCAVIDELAAIKNRDLYDLVVQAMGARQQPLLFCITTNGFMRNGVFDAQYEYASKILDGTVKNKRFLPLIYELDSYDEWDDPKMWIKANPGLGTIKKVEYLEQMVQKAKDDPSFKPTVMVKDFNLPQTSATRWLTMEIIKNDLPIPDYSFRYGIGGWDAADSVDLTAACLLMMRPNDEHIYRKSMYWIPRGKLQEAFDSGKRQGVDTAPYDLWEKQGRLRVVEGNKVMKKDVLEWFIEQRDVCDIYISYIGYDPWHIDDSTLELFRQEFGEKSMIPVRQGVYTLSQPMKDLKADMEAGLIVDGGNPIDRWCWINMEIKTDTNGNIQPVKSSAATQRIDGGVSCINAYKVLQDKKEEYLTMI